LFRWKELPVSFEVLAADVLFRGVPLWQVGFIALAYFFGFLVRGAFGFGSNIPIVLLTTPILGPHDAIVLTAIASFMAQIDLLPQGLRTADWKVSKPLIAGMLAGTAVGTWLLTLWTAEWLEISMGLLIMAIIGMERLQLMERIAQRVDLRSGRITSTLAVTAGMVGTVSGGGSIYLLVPYLKLACRTPQTFRGTNLVLSGFFLTGRALFLVIVGLVTLAIVAEALLLMPAILAGTWAGTRFFRTASPQRFWGTLQALLICGALVLVGKGFAKMR
jgi:uncharacterized membrane protein YfcA